MSKDSEILQLVLQALERWEKDWLMSFNATKCSVIRISPMHKKAKESTYKLHGQILADEEAENA